MPLLGRLAPLRRPPGCVRAGPAIPAARDVARGPVHRRAFAKPAPYPQAQPVSDATHAGGRLPFGGSRNRPGRRVLLQALPRVTYLVNQSTSGVDPGKEARRWVTSPGCWCGPEWRSPLSSASTRRSGTDAYRGSAEPLSRRGSGGRQDVLRASSKTRWAVETKAPSRSMCMCRARRRSSYRCTEKSGTVQWTFLRKWTTAATS